MKILKEITVNHGGISDIKVRKDRKIFATAGWDHRIRIFNFKKLSPLAILKGHTENVLSIDFSPFLQNEGNLLASGSKDKRILIW